MSTEEQIRKFFQLTSVCTIFYGFIATIPQLSLLMFSLYLHGFDSSKVAESTEEMFGEMWELYLKKVLYVYGFSVSAIFVLVYHRIV